MSCLWCDDWIDLCQCEFKLYSFVCSFTAPGLPFLVDLMEMQIWAVAPFALKKRVSYSWKIHQIQKSTIVLTENVPAGLVDLKKLHWHEWKFYPKLAEWFIGPALEVKVWLAKPLSPLLVLPHCTSYLSCWVILSQVINRHSAPNHCHLSAITEWAAHFRVGKTAQLGHPARGIGALSQEMSVVQGWSQLLGCTTALLLLPAL